MAASVVSAIATAPDFAWKRIQAAIENLLDNLTTGDGGRGAGIPFSYGDSVSLATASLDEANDTVRLFLFPPGSYIDDFRGTITDIDTNATPTAVYSIAVLDADNVVKDTLVASSTNGQGGGTDRITNAAVGQFVGDRYLALKMGTAAATPAVGTYGYYVKFTPGVLSLLSVDENPATTDIGV